MKPGPLPAVDVPDDLAGQPICRRAGPLPTRVGVTRPAPDEPLAVVAVGPAGAGRRAVLAALLGRATRRCSPCRPAAGWWSRHARAPTRAAYVPGYRQPHAYGARPARRRPGAGPPAAPGRAERAGAAAAALRAGRHAGHRRARRRRRPGAARRGRPGRRAALRDRRRPGVHRRRAHLLAEVAAAPVGSFFAVTPGAAGWAAAGRRRGDDGGRGGVRPAGRRRVAGRRAADPVDRRRVAAHRAALLAAVPALAAARWFPVGRRPTTRRPAPGAGELGRRRGAAPGQRRAAGAAGRARPGARSPPTRATGPSGWTGRPAPAPSGSASTSRWSWPTSTCGWCRRSSSGSAAPACRSCWTARWQALSLLATAQCDQAGARHRRRRRDAGLRRAAGRGRPAPDRDAVRWGLADHRGRSRTSTGCSWSPARPAWPR